MEVKILEGVITLEMSREEAIALTIALKSEVERLFTYHKKYRLMPSWDDLAIMGKVKDELDPLLRSGGDNLC